MASELVERLRACHISRRIPGTFMSETVPEPLSHEAADRIEALEARERVLVEALKPIAEAMKWEETEGNFGAAFLPAAPVERFRDEVELRIVAWWGQDWELESADTFCTLGDLRRVAKVMETK